MIDRLTLWLNAETTDREDTIWWLGMMGMFVVLAFTPFIAAWIIWIIS